MKIYFVLFGFFLLFSCDMEEKRISFPYSQWTVGEGSNNISWQYVDNVEMNPSFIKTPDEESWESWYKKIKEYKKIVHERTGKETPYLVCGFPAKQETKIHFDKFAYQLKLQAFEEIEISGFSKAGSGSYVLYFDFDLKKKGEELSYVVRKKIKTTDSIVINASDSWKEFVKTIHIPAFSNDSFALAPILRIQAQETDSAKLFLKDIQLKTRMNDVRKMILDRINNYLDEQMNHSQFTIPKEFDWTHQNFVMGFVFVWDNKFWDPAAGKYLVDEYCNTMQKEFGGIQSVVLWHSYPNIGIDERNQFEMFRNLPGGIQAVKAVVEDFHRNNVKVFITYNPWDLDTCRPKNHDFKELAQIIHETGADGVYLDTWRCSRGVISVFEAEKSIREEVAQYGKTVAFSTEILPELKDLIGTDALTCSWGQEIHPYHYSDLSHLKWLMPEHKQHYIKRMTKDRKPLMAHAWLNGQGIQLWENIFGTMNLWNAEHRKILRKMNAIWKEFGLMLISDQWKPFIPTGNKEVLASQWTSNGMILTQIVNRSSTPLQWMFEVQDSTARYYDLWKGQELQPLRINGRFWVELKLEDFGCLLQTKKQDPKITGLLALQQKENKIPIPAEDEYSRELSLKKPVVYSYGNKRNKDFNPDLLKMQGEEMGFISRHIWREGECYPNEGAKNNHDLEISREEGFQQVVHHHKCRITDYSIMTRAVTNGQFEQFLIATGYQPRFQENFLQHWKGKTCPDTLKNKPVVYVSLEDARSFAEWAGMQLPGEWEWQFAAEKYPKEFIINEVFEWNESERFDGFNRSLSLRGGCSRWTLNSSWWYFPGAPYGEIAGAAQSIHSHVKYFLMFPGMDRASTIGFRCMKK